MHPSDEELVAWIRATGHEVAEVFLAGGRAYVSKHAGDFRHESTYAPLRGQRLGYEEALVSFLRRSGAPEYESTSQVDDEINQYREWEALYSELMQVLEHHGKHDPFGDDDYFLIDDYYSSPQHKVECTSAMTFTPPLVADIQKVLRRYERPWEVIFVVPRGTGNVVAYSVNGDSCIEHRSERHG
jgi:hypothetical protein